MKRCMSLVTYLTKLKKPTLRVLRKKLGTDGQTRKTACESNCKDCSGQRCSLDRHTDPPGETGGAAGGGEGLRYLWFGPAFLPVGAGGATDLYYISARART